MEKLELLIKYSDQSTAKCMEALEKADGNFFQALYDLTIPEQAKDDLIEKCIVNELELCLEVLDNIMKFYSCDIVGNAIMDGLLNEVEFPEDVLNNLKYETQKPTPIEIQKYQEILDSGHFELIEKTLKIISHIPEQCRPLINSLKKFFHHRKPAIYEPAIKVFADMPDGIEGCIPEFIKLLQSRDQHKRFQAIWVLSRETTPVFKETIQHVMKLLDNDSQIADMAKQILIRYSPDSEQQIEERLEQIANERVSAIELELKFYTAEMLHSFALNYNWDDGLEYLKAVNKHPNCDIMTAKYIYWAGRPHWDAQYSSIEDVPEYARDQYRFMQVIEENIENGRYISTGIQWFSENDARFELTEDCYPEIEKVREIPLFMYPFQMPDK